MHDVYVKAFAKTKRKTKKNKKQTHIFYKDERFINAQKSFFILAKSALRHLNTVSPHDSHINIIAPTLNANNVAKNFRWTRFLHMPCSLSFVVCLQKILIITFISKIYAWFCHFCTTMHRYFHVLQFNIIKMVH